MPPLVPRTALASALAGVLLLGLGACGERSADDAGSAVDTVGAAGAVEEAAVGAPGGPEGPGTGASDEAPPETDILLGAVRTDADGMVAVTDVQDAVRRPGYDNQPHFLRDGTAFLYTAAGDEGSADIWRYDLATGSIARVTDTRPESEYSPTPLPVGPGFSVIRVEADSTQRLWRFDADGSEAEPLLPEVAPVGYHAWVDLGSVALFLLGDPPTLRIGRLALGDAVQVAAGIGRSLQTLPPVGRSGTVSWVDASGETPVLMLWSREGGPRPMGAPPLPEGADGTHAWTPGDVLLISAGTRILGWWAPGGADDWTEVVDLADLDDLDVASVSRMAVSPDGSRIAVVVEREGDGG